MRHLEKTNKFVKDYELAKRRGNNLEKLAIVLELILNNRAIPAHYRNHRLKGKYKDCMELHIEPDLLLVYRFLQDGGVVLERMGSHSDLFK